MRSTIFHSNASVVNWQGCAATGGVCERGPDDVGRRKNGGCLIATSSSPARSYITPTSFICPNFIFHSHLHVMVADMILLSPTQHLLAPTSSTSIVSVISCLSITSHRSLSTSSPQSRTPLGGSKWQRWSCSLRTHTRATCQLSLAWSVTSACGMFWWKS